MSAGEVQLWVETAITETCPGFMEFDRYEWSSDGVEIGIHMELRLGVPPSSSSASILERRIYSNVSFHSDKLGMRPWRC